MVHHIHVLRSEGRMFCILHDDYMYSVYGAELVSGPVLAFITGFHDKDVPWLLVMRWSPTLCGSWLTDVDGCIV